MVSTQMACRQLALESSFLKALQMVDNFTISADNLSLNRARMAPWPGSSRCTMPNENDVYLVNNPWCLTHR